MIKTLSLKDFDKYAENIYEAIIILAKRARQINDEQKQLLHREEEEYDDYDEELPDSELLDVDYLKLPKPTTLALEEFLTGKIHFKYKEVDKEEEKEN
ncbi:MAG: DNA-directed RNA polymerase subunit omega [bacterium]